MANVENKYYLCDSDFFCDFKNINVVQNLIVMYTNAQSCSNFETFDQIRGFIKECQCNLDIIVLAETWFKKTETLIYNIEGYAAFHSCRSGKRGGGVSIYVRLPSQIMDVEVIESDVNVVCIDMVNYKNIDRTRIIGAYRPPNAGNYGGYMTTLEKIINERRVKNTILVGDVNVNVSQSGEVVDANATYRDYVTQIRANGLNLCNTNVTRERSGTLIDHFFSSSTEIFPHGLDTIRNTFSDHNIIVSRVRCTTGTEAAVMMKRRIDYVKLNDLISLETATKMPSSEDVDAQYDFLIDAIVSSTEHATTRYAVNRKRTKMCEWVECSPNVLILINQKKNLWKKYKKNLRNNVANDEVQQRLNEINRKLVKVKSMAKEKYYGRRFAHAVGSKDTWNVIREIISIGKQPTRNTISLEHVNSEAVAESFAEHFATVGEILAEKIEAKPGDHFNLLDTMKRVEQSIFWQPVTQLEVHSLIQAVNVKKAAGIDNISAAVIKNCENSIAPALTKIFNDSLSSGFYPQGMKIARVTPIYKSGSKISVSNYRPISVLPILNNIFERVIYTRLLNFLERYDVLYCFQYGFRRKIGTSTALNEIINMIQCNLNDRKKAAGLFMDLTKAFDTVNHQILLGKLETYGIRGTPLKLFTSYLANRSIVVRANNMESSQHTIGISVPQGSVLGPILYLLYVNDMGALKLNGKLRLFADDSSTFYQSNSNEVIVQHLKEDVDLLQEYFRLNRLTLNLNKTKYVKFGRSHNDANDSISTASAVIEHSDCIKYLGLYIDGRLSWKHHIEAVAAKIAGAIGALGKIHFLPRKILQSIYYSIVHPHLQYASSIWSSARKTHLNILQLLQRKALKRCHKLDNRHNTEDLFCNQATTVLPVRALGVMQICSVVYNTINHFERTNLTFPRAVSTRLRRTEQRFISPVPHNYYGESSIQYRGPKEFQELPVEIRNSENYKSFRIRLKKYMQDGEVKINYVR